MATDKKAQFPPISSLTTALKCTKGMDFSSLTDTHKWFVSQHLDVTQELCHTQVPQFPKCLLWLAATMAEMEFQYLWL